MVIDFTLFTLLVLSQRKWYAPFSVPVVGIDILTSVVAEQEVIVFLLPAQLAYCPASCAV